MSDLKVSSLENKNESKDEKKNDGPAESALSLDGPGLTGDLKLTSKDKKDFTVSKKNAFISNLVKVKKITVLIRDSAFVCRQDFARHGRFSH